MLDLAQRTLAFSPEPRVIDKLLDSAWLLGRGDLLAYYLPRYQAAFPDEAQEWLRLHR